MTERKQNSIRRTLAREAGLLVGFLFLGLVLLPASAAAAGEGVGTLELAGAADLGLGYADLPLRMGGAHDPPAVLLSGTRLGASLAQELSQRPPARVRADTDQGAAGAPAALGDALDHLRGLLHVEPIWKVLLDLAVAEATGLVIFQQERSRKEVYFIDGNLWVHNKPFGRLRFLKEAHLGLIVAHEVSKVGSDRQQLSKMAKQAKAILDLRLHQLTGLEQDKLRSEYEEVKATIEDLKDILAREERRMEIIKDELLEVKEKYGDPRRSEINYAGGDLSIEDMIPDEQVVITMFGKPVGDPVNTPGLKFKLPWIIPGIGSTNIAKNNWEGLAIGSALAGTGLTIGENVVGMDPEALKRRFGDQVVFWGGGVDTQHTLPFGTPDEVRRELRLDSLACSVASWMPTEFVPWPCPTATGLTRSVGYTRASRSWVSMTSVSKSASIVRRASLALYASSCSLASIERR